jgi:hypothetical protein
MTLEGLCKVRLETEGGCYVTTGVLPPFQQWPAVVTWGDRIFQLQTVTKEGKMTTYHEVFAVAVVHTEQEG